MASQEPHTLSPAARSAALLVARIIFFNGLLIGLGLCAAAVGVLFFQIGNVSAPMERWLVGAVLIGLGVMAFGFTAMAKSRIAKLKKDF
ncbi:MAG: hypothetical protein ABIS50_10625 [Luteolibacter sp.]|uniref:hypothetical protein n=1 Tax=Luteolibacter sp. TaxID=1962973 RepID=UPI003264EC20